MTVIDAVRDALIDYENGILGAFEGDKKEASRRRASRSRKYEMTLSNDCTNARICTAMIDFHILHKRHSLMLETAVICSLTAKPNLILIYLSFPVSLPSNASGVINFPCSDAMLR